MKTKWIPYPTILEGETVDLIPLEKNTLKNCISQQQTENFGNWSLQTVQTERFSIKTMNWLYHREKLKTSTLSLYGTKTGKLIGSTRFLRSFLPTGNWKSDGPGLLKFLGHLR
jgi:hypothetical protein